MVLLVPLRIDAPDVTPSSVVHAPRRRLHRGGRHWRRLDLRLQVRGRVPNLLTSGNADDPNSLDENFDLNHDRPFLLSMANAGKHTNGSQFFITVAPAKWLNGKHVVFGEVVTGEKVVREIEKLGSDKGPPTKIVTIQNCGLI